MKITRTAPHTPHRRLLSAALASCLVFTAPQLLAQSTGATIRGQVSADSAPATDASITATNTETGLARTVQATPAGTYSVAGLPPGTYKVDVSAGGQTTSKTITVLVGQTATLDMGVGGVAETATSAAATDLDTVKVTAVSAVETKTSEIATYVSSKQIDALPQGSRNFLAFADIVPGVDFKTGSEGSTSLRSGAQLSNGINVFIDGVGQKDYVLKGGVTGQDSSRGNPFPQLGIAEYKVVTSNYKAEYDQLSSAGITAVTKSGTNAFQGSFFWDYTSDKWREPTPNEDRAGFKTPSKEEQYGASFGGPIIQDKMHFFITYEAKEYDSPREITLGRSFTADQLPPDLREQALQTVSAPFKEDLYFGKIDFTPAEGHLLELTSRYRKEDELTGIGGQSSAEYGTLKAGEETRIDLRYQFSSQDWLNDAHLTFEDVTFGPRPATIAPGYLLQAVNLNDIADTEIPDTETILRVGGGRDLQDKGQKGYSFQNDLTYFGWEGHTVKAGVKVKQVDISALQRNPANAQFYYDIARDPNVPYQVDISASGSGSGGAIQSDSKQFGIYVQDDWDVNDRLTLNLGVRWDYEQTPSYEDFQTPGAIVQALQNNVGVNSPNAGYDYRDYVSTGNNRDAFKDAFQPRIGFSYDLTDDESAVVFGGAGRSYDRNQFDYLAREQYGIAFPSNTYYFDTPGHDCSNREPDRCIAFDPSYLDQTTLDALIASRPPAGREVFLINNDLKTPYSDQFSLGIRNTFDMFGQGWNSSATLLHILSHDGILFTVGNRRDDGSFFPPNRNFGNSPPGNLGGGYGRLLLGDNAVETRLNSVLLSLEKPFSTDSGWGATFAYTYSDAKENLGNSDTFSFDYPNLDDVAFTPALDIAKHRFVATGIVDFYGVTLSAKLKLTSPVARNATACRVDVSNCFFDPVYPGDDIAFKQLDLAAQKVWDTGSNVKLRVRADLLNVFNWRNYNDYDLNRGTYANPYDTPTVAQNLNENFQARNSSNIDLPTRTFKLSFGLDF